MRSINRFAIVVRPQAPYFDWARSLDGGLPETVEAWTSVYLVPAKDTDDLNEIARRFHAEIFEEQLASWHRRAEDWPNPRPFDLFQKWFDVAVVDLVLDVSNHPIRFDD